jgi:phosphoribosyl-AMP cyclohydrolase
MTIQTTALPITFGEAGLIPAVIEDATSGAVLMVGFMNEEAFSRTRETGFVHFWSRSRQKLWLKGETSGHTQRVIEIRVNCENNSLLIEVEQIAAVCHTGYPTCFYRRLEDDNSLTVVRERVFDPDDVYGQSDARQSGPDLKSLTGDWWRAFELLRDHDFTSESGTSRMLRDPQDRITPRIADEFRELAGVLDGSHVHQGEAADAALEGGQVCYWLAIRSVRTGRSWGEVRPDRGLAPPILDDIPAQGTLVRLLLDQADRWSAPDRDADALTQESFSLVAAALTRVAVDPLNVIAADLTSMRDRPYLAELLTADDDPT